MSAPRVPILLIVLALAASGCTGAATDPLGRSVPDPQSPVAEFGSDEGAIAGTALDESFLPVPNATVVLAGLRDGVLVSDTLSSETGKFVFSYISPGNYRLTVRASGFANRSVIVQVAANTVTDVSVVLSQVPSPEPHVLTASKNMMQTCANMFVFLAFQGYCNRGGIYYGDNNPLVLNVSAGHRATLVEFDWRERHVSAGWYLSISVNNTTTGRLADPGRGDNVFPVVRVAMVPGGTYTNATGTQTGPIPAIPYPSPDEPFRLSGGAYYNGQYRNTFRPYNPNCDSGGYCGGVGFLPDWRYSAYFSVFMNEAPATLAAYSALPDG